GRFGRARWRQVFSLWAQALGKWTSQADFAQLKRVFVALGRGTKESRRRQGWLEQKWLVFAFLYCGTAGGAWQIKGEIRVVQLLKKLIGSEVTKSKLPFRRFPRPPDPIDWVRTRAVSGNK